MTKLLFKTMMAALLLAAFTFTSCKDDEEEVKTKNIAELATATADLSSLVAALNRAELTSTFTGTTQYTVFAPTNAAFTKFLADNNFANLEAVPVDLLKQVLAYHVVAGEVKSTALATGYVKTIAEFGTTKSLLSLFVNTTGGVTLGNGVKVITADVDANNGVVHIVDKVIALPSVVTLATSNPGTFSTLVSALTRPDLGVDYVALLAGTANSPFTVFAPTNDAFAKLLTDDLKLPNLAAIPAATLNAVLQYHVVAGANVLAASLKDKQEVPTFLGADKKFTIDLSTPTSPKIKDGANRVTNIVVTDVQANNGVVHAIDRVLLPQ
jgi:uncharacterized surface protein with fasciclin (FAS1) repeats